MSAYLNRKLSFLFSGVTDQQSATFLHAYLHLAATIHTHIYIYAALDFCVEEGKGQERQRQRPRKRGGRCYAAK